MQSKISSIVRFDPNEGIVWDFCSLVEVEPHTLPNSLLSLQPVICSSTLPEPQKYSDLVSPFFGLTFLLFGYGLYLPTTLIPKANLVRLIIVRAYSNQPLLISRDPFDCSI